MNIIETINQHIKLMPSQQALEVLHFITFIETKVDSFATIKAESDILEFIQKLPITQSRNDIEINQTFQSLRDEWQ